MLVAGGRHFTDYPTLRAALDALVVNRLHDVGLLTAGGRGVPMLVASYAAERGLVVTALVPDFGRFPADASERRDAFLVTQADAVVVVWDGRDPTRGGCGAEHAVAAGTLKDGRSRGCRRCAAVRRHASDVGLSAHLPELSRRAWRGTCATCGRRFTGTARQRYCARACWPCPRPERRAR